MQRKPDRLLADVFDVLIIGGGIYGVCAAWDAAHRGLSVALVEKGDFGHATSANTLRIIHGGFRYLQHGNIRRMRRLMVERAIFMRIAPHLVHPLPFLIPTYKHLWRSKQLFHLALLANDLIGFDRNHLEDPQKYLPRGRVISRDECLQMVPGLDETGLTGAAIVYDAQMYSSERLVISFARSAAEAGAQMANYVEVIGFLVERGRVAGVKGRDLLTGDEFDIRARVVVNTSGPWLDRVVGLLNGDRSKPRQALSKAFNILVNRQLIPEYALGVYSKSRFEDRDALVNKGSRLYFITPWHNHSLIGTAHLPHDADPDSSKPTEKEIRAFIDEINRAYPTVGLKPQDVSFVYGGLVPMVGNGHEQNDVQLMKRYRIHDHYREGGVDGLISVSGVKYTEARHVTEQAVSLVFKKLGKTPPESRTAFTPLHGGRIEQFNAFLAREIRRRAEGISAEVVQYLIDHYGSAYPEVLKYLDATPESAIGIADALPILKAQVLYSAREEMAQKLSDVVFRRTTLGIIGNPDETSLRTYAVIMARELGWDEIRIQTEIDEVRAFFPG